MGVLDVPFNKNLWTPYVDSLQVINTKALDAFWAGLADCANNPCDILTTGDSRTEGQATTVVTDRWIDQFLALQRAKYQPSSIVGGRGYIPAAYAFLSPTGQGPTLGGTVTTDYVVSQTYGLGRRAVILNTTSGLITWPAITCTSADLVYNNQVSGTKLSGQFGSDTVTGVTTNSTGGTQKLRVTPVGGRGSNILKVAYVTASAAVANIEGAFFMDGDENAGIRLWDGAHYGFSVASFTGLENWKSSMQFGITSTNLKLAIIALGTNDCIGTSSATFKTNLTTLIADMRTKAPAATTSYVLLADADRTTTGTAHTEPWANYVAAMKAIAVADPTICFVDLSTNARMPTGDADTLSRFNADLIHENRKGHRQKAHILDRVLSPR